MAAPARSTNFSSNLPTISDTWLLGGTLLLTLLVFANVLGAGFVNWDDHGYLWLNQLVQPLSGTALKNMFTGHTCGNYSPLVVLTYCLEHGFDKVVKPGEMVPENFNPFIYHLNNLLLHAGTTALVFFFLRDLGVKGWGLVFATALFGIHPMRVESVAWVTERKDVLYGLFYVAALRAYWHYLTQDAQKGLFYGLTLGLGLLSLFSKIQAVSLPLSMLALDYFAGRKLTSTKVWLEKAPFFALSLVFGLVGIHFLDLAEGFKDTGYPLGSRLLFGAWSLCAYLGKAIFPFGLAAYYPYPALGKLPLHYYLAPLLLLGLGYVLWRSSTHKRALLFGFGFFLVNIMFVLQIKGAGKAYLADRFTYIPYLGLFFLAGYGFNAIAEGRLWPSLRKSLPFLAGAFLILCAALTIRQNTSWKDSLALWDNVARVSPQDYLAWNNKGLALDELQRYEEAVQAYTQANTVDPGNYDAHHNLGVALFKLKQYEASIAAFSKAAANKPSEPDIFYNRGQTYQQLKNHAAALADFEKAVQLGCKKPVRDIQLSLGLAYAGLNRHNEAINAFDVALKAKPDADCHYQKGNSYAALNNMAEAVRQYEAATQLKPDFTDAWNNMGNALAVSGNFSAAIPAYDKAIALNGGASNVWFNRGMARNSAGDRAGACADWQKAEALGYPNAKLVLEQNCR